MLHHSFSNLITVRLVKGLRFYPAATSRMSAWCWNSPSSSLPSAKINSLLQSKEQIIGPQSASTCFCATTIRHILQALFGVFRVFSLVVLRKSCFLLFPHTLYTPYTPYTYTTRTLLLCDSYFNFCYVVYPSQVDAEQHNMTTILILLLMSVKMRTMKRFNLLYWLAPEILWPYTEHIDRKDDWILSVKLPWPQLYLWIVLWVRGLSVLFVSFVTF